MARDPLLVVVLGPTGSGKTALSLALAGHFSGEIVSCDSVALYRDFEIGTAKPSRDERARVPHHLLDVADPSTAVTAGEYARQARALVEEIGSQGKVPIVVGGTGLYLRALLQGLFPGPQRLEDLRERLREKARQRGSAHLHKILRRLDPAAAAKIHANDAAKLVRAIEVCAASRNKMSELWKNSSQPLLGFRIRRFGLNPDREKLYQRINQRAAHMFSSGLIEETRRLLAVHGEHAWPLRSLGYKQAAQVIRGEITLEAAITAAQQGHRNYAKRQMTWFRREPDVTWLAGFGDQAAVQELAIKQVQDLL